MDDFWNNITRYPRFLLSSLLGLILVILTPFKNLLKISKFRIAIFCSLGLMIYFLVLVLKSMTAL